MTDILLEIEQVDVALSNIDDDKEDFDSAYCALLGGRLNHDEFQQLLHERSETDFGHVWSAYRRCMLNLVEVYCQSDETARVEIRNQLTLRPFVLIYSTVLAEELTHAFGFTKDTTSVYQALLIVSMCDSCDAHSLATHFALTRLYNTASDLGIDPIPYFVEVAAMSSDVARNDSTTSTRKFLSTFQPVRSW
jgi:hypothetical protein